MRARRAVAVLVLAVGLVAGPSVTPLAGARECALNLVDVHTLKLQIRSAKKTYRVGQTARIIATVTRPGSSDPATGSVEWSAPAGAPAPGVGVLVVLDIKNVSLWGSAVTDNNGRASVPVRLPRSTPSGRAGADALGVKVQADSPCATAREVGYVSRARLMRIRR